jgi:Alpha amylase, catalytic domain/Secretion system C-terminal sorting domain
MFRLIFRLKKGFFVLLALLLINGAANAQVVTITPTFATQFDQVTVIFDASKGNKALLGQSVVYAHTGVITNLSSSPSAWRYVQGNWGTDDAKVKMTNLGNNLFSLTYTINSFYGVPSGEQVLKLAFVFRNQSGSIVGREADGADIFVNISNGSFQARFETNNAQIIKTTQAFNIKAISSAKANLKLYKNGQEIVAINNDSVLNYTEAANTNSLGKYTYIFEAFKNGNFYRDTIYTIYRSTPSIANPPLGTKDGINYLSDTSVILQLHSPFKEFAFVIGDFNNWEFDTKYYMKKSPSGQKLWLQINGLTKGQNYRFQYVVDSTQIRIADVYAETLLDANNDPFVPSITYPNLIPYPTGRTSEYVSVLNTQKENFNWQHSENFIRPAKEKMFIYELHLRDFIARHDFQTLKDTLSYLSKLGINTIELMPINEFEGNESWGYNPSFYFAVDKYYGTKNAMKAFVDECHRLGIAVVIDMVLNHSFGQSPMVRLYFDKTNNRPTSDNPWFNTADKHPFGVGYDFNHESQATKDFSDSVIKFWLQEYKIDGYRFDLSKGFTQKNTTDVGAWGLYDAGRIAIWKRIYNKVRTYDSTCYLILEHFADNNEEKELADYGFMLWGNMNHNYNEASMGYVSTSNLNGGDYKTRSWSKPHLVTYAESHDEERLMYKNIQFGNSSGNYNIKTLKTGLKRIEATMCFLIPQQGPRMIWQFGELGYDYSIDFNGRVGNKPIRWDYFNEAGRKRIYEVTSILGWLKNTQPSYSSSNYTFNGNGAVKLYKVNDANLNTVCVANFNVRTDSIVPTFQHTGVWYEIFTRDSITVSDVQQKVVLQAGEYKFYVDKQLMPPTVLTSIQTKNKKVFEVNIYPNPVEEEIVMEWTSSKDPVNIEVYDLLGKKVAEKKIEFSDGLEVFTKSELNLNQGTYIISIQQSNNTYKQKIIIL